MRILSVHNYYLQSGGEDTVFQLEAGLLRDRGHAVIEFLDDNHRIEHANRLGIALQTIWSTDSYYKIKKVLMNERPDVAHFHNTFPLISPSAYYACRDMHVPVVQNLDNQRLICPAASFYRAGKLCLDCLGKTPPWPAVLHACYHNSLSHSAVVAGMLTIHRWLKTWTNLVDIYIASTNFYRDIFVRAGFPPEKLVVKPHFVQAGSDPVSPRSEGEYALFIGRLDPEKGIRTLLEAWMALEIPLKIRGGGQLEAEAREFVRSRRISTIEFVSRLSQDELSALIRNARFLVFPSEGYYETFGMVAVECYSMGVPVLASRIGVMTEMIVDGETGRHFEPGDAQDLAEKALWLWNHPHETQQMGKRALELFHERFSAEPAYQGLMSVYQRLMREKPNV